MEPDDDRERAPQRKGISYSQPLSRDAAAQAEYARHAALSSHSLDDDPIASAHRHAPARFVPYPHQLPPHRHHDRGGQPVYSSSASFGGGGEVTLERAVTTSNYGAGPLPEFVGAGGGEGIFRVPLRAAMHPGRPPALEVRPHPPRETQVCSFLRTLACEPRLRQLWAGAESGVRVWGLDKVFDGCVPAARRGDEESPPFAESVLVPPVLCTAVDSANRLVWTGHKDGRIRSWRMDLATAPAAAGDDGEEAPMFKEALTWQAHNRTPVLSMVVTSYGEKLNSFFINRNLGSDSAVDRNELPEQPGNVTADRCDNWKIST
jgi:hypothetical protein